MPSIRELTIAVYVSRNPTECQMIQKIIEQGTQPIKLEIISCRSREELMVEVKRADIAFCYNFTEEMLTQAQRLKWIHFGSAGVDQTLFPALLESDVVITNSKGMQMQCKAMSEFVIGMMLHFSTRLDRAFRELYLNREWKWQIALSSFVLEDKTLGIVGLGSVGTAVAEKAKAFGMRVIAIRRHPDGEIPDCVDIILGLDELEELLRQSDFVVLTVPYTKETHHLIGKGELAQMKKTSYLINVARGGIVDEAALITALRENHIAGAGLDVFETEPLSADSELFELDNVLITPHISGIFHGFVRSVAECFAKNLYRYVNNEPLFNIVNKRLGY